VEVGGGAPPGAFRCEPGGAFAESKFHRVTDMSKVRYCARGDCEGACAARGSVFNRTSRPVRVEIPNREHMAQLRTALAAAELRAVGSHAGYRPLDFPAF
jgi:hypothetical protein